MQSGTPGIKHYPSNKCFIINITGHVIFAKRSRDHNFNRMQDLPQECDEDIPQTVDTHA